MLRSGPVAFPSSAEGERRLAEAVQAISSWSEDAGSDARRLRDHRNALEQLLAAEPQGARGVASFALGSMLVIVGVAAEATLRLGEIAQRAALLCARPDGVDTTRAVLIDFTMAEAAILGGRPLDAVDHARAGDRRAASGRLPAALARFLAAYSELLRARVHEDGLEGDAAAAAYDMALAQLGRAIARTDERAAITRGCTAALGEAIAEDREGVIERAVVAGVIVSALLGRLRCPGVVDRARLWDLSRRLVARYGLPATLGPRQLAATAAAVAEVSGPFDAVEFFDALSDDTLRQAGLEPSDCRARVAAAIARTAAAEGDVVLCDLLQLTAARQMRAAGSATRAFVLANYVRDGAPDEALEALIAVLGASAQQTTVADKAMLEPAFLVLLDYLLGLWRADPSSRFARLRVGMLVELFTRPTAALLPSRTDLAQMRERRQSLVAAWTASDWLGRIQRALRRRAGTAVIVMSTVADRTTFLCLTPGAERAAYADAFHDDLPAAHGLAQAAAEEFDFAQFSDQIAASPAFVERCRTAWDELPELVRDLIAVHDTLLVVGDARAEGIPLDLLHDGDEHVGATRVVAWFPSLRGVTMALEGTTAVSARRRAVVAAAARVEGAPALMHANVEADRVSELLRERGWDVPPISSELLDPAFIVDRVPHIAVLHLAAHGVATAAGEALLLPGGQRLVASDFGTERRSSMPFVYLNACDLGTTRYLGGGLRRGVAHSLLELGAPAMLSSRTPVDDRVAALLSATFYAETATVPVGEALRRARAAVAARGVGAASWATTVLLGDPSLRLTNDGGAPERDVADALLDAFAAPERDDQRVSDLATRAMRRLDDDPDDPKLDAALRLVATLTEGEEPNLRGALKAAEELGNSSMVAMLRLAAADELEAGAEEDALALIGPALPVLDALRAAEPAWAERRLRGYGRWKQLDAWERAEGIMVPDREESGDQHGGIAAVAIAEGTRRLALRVPEAGVDDITWNTVLLGHPLRFEAPGARVDVAACIAAKLSDAGAIPPLGTSTTVLTGMLSYLWGALTALDADNASAAAHVLRRSIGDLRIAWAAPVGEWFDLVSAFRLEVLDAAHADALDESSQRLRESYVQTASTLRHRHTFELANCCAYMLGSIVEAYAAAGAASLGVLYSAAVDDARRFRQLHAYSIGWRLPDDLASWRLSDGWHDPHPGRSGTGSERRCPPPSSPVSPEPIQVASTSREPARHDESRPRAEVPRPPQPPRESRGAPTAIVHVRAWRKLAPGMSVIAV